MDFLIKILIPLFAAFILQANSLDRVAVIVNDGVVLESEINQKITDIEKASALNGEKLPSKDEIRNKVIEELILEELQLQVADQVGIKISDEELNVTLKRLAQQSDLDLESFIKFVEDQGDSYEQVRENVKRTMKIQRVQQGRIQNKIQITREELNNFLNTEEAKSQLGPELGVKQILVRNNSDKNIDEVYQTAKQQIEAGINPTEVFKNLSEDQNGGDLGYRNITKFPGVFQDPINELEIGEFSEVIETGAGKHILYLDDKRGPMVTFEKQWEVRHILLIPNRIRDENDSEDAITEIRNRIISGESFGELAREFSDDPGSKQEGGRLDWAPEGTYAPEFEKVMTESSENQISEPFLTQFGWHILEVTGIRVVDKTNERMEDQAFSYLFNRKFQEELETDLQELRAEAFVEIKES
ncbi:MAG: peptidylprolyl isomerase [Pseudomonadota bacterium]|jgi:peptidyl-prolyl cis-trans isomerase SurA|nr:rotamase [Gammaproteobacteria bacterium]MEC8152959.1 peptidylprolyl isomerase [Pseudomonadota bacterium]|tara:strand:- start:2531 stop:3775 length:1245 start_codon:yes stop_codon:yes gene_type:complete